MPRTADVDLEFAGRIVKNDQEAVDYFIGDFSHPILNYIYANVLWLKSDPDVYQELSGDYYLFIAAPFAPLAGWSKIKAYKGKNNAKLYSYVSKMASNYFRRKRGEYGKYDKNQMKLWHLYFTDKTQSRYNLDILGRTPRVSGGSDFFIAQNLLFIP